MIKNTFFIFGMMCYSLYSLAEELPDPTMPANFNARDTVITAESPQQQLVTNATLKLTLNSTLVSPSHKVAIINGVQFKVGDELTDGSILKSITHQQVKIQQQDGSIVTLTLQKSFISNMKSSPTTQQ